MTHDATLASVSNPPAATEPSRLHQTHLSREQILRATAKSLGDDGYDATTIRKIAGMLDCAVGSIYRYFKDKRELLYAVTQELLQPVAAMVEHGGPLEETVTAYHRMASGETATYRLMFWLASVQPAAGGDTAAVPAIVRRILDGWAAQLGDARLAQRVWTKVHGAVMLGDSVDETLRAIQPLLGRVPEARPASGGDGQAQIVTHAIPVPPPRHHAGHESEDVCLL